MGAEILTGNPALSEIAVLESGDGDRATAIGRLLEKERPDAVLCTNLVSGHVELIAAARAGVPNRVAFAHKGFSSLITHPVFPEDEISYPHAIRTMVAQLVGIEPSWSVRPVVFVSDRDEARAAQLFSRVAADRAPVIAAALTTRQSSYRPPVDLLLSVLGQVAAETRVRVVLTGAAADLEEIRAISARASFPHEVVAGELSPREFVAFLGRCALLLSSDTGARHLANAAGIPVIFARNPIDSALTNSYCPSEIDVVPPVSWLRPEAQESLYASISPEKVADLVLRSLGAPAGAR
jgi:ADP-heptose:LPS heptosyltransferase